MFCLAYASQIQEDLRNASKYISGQHVSATVAYAAQIQIALRTKYSGGQPAPALACAS